MTDYERWEIESWGDNMPDADFPKGMVEEWEAFLAADKTPPGLDVYDAVFETGLCFPLQRKAELRRMIEVARSVEPKTVMEIGADKGGGLYHWCKIPTVRNVIACEIRGTPYIDAFRRAFPDLQLMAFGRSSLDPTVWGAVSHNCGLIDVLFIDGDKTKFVEDFDAYLPLMNPRGVVFMHDITDREPGRAFEAVQSRGYRTEWIVDRSEAFEAVSREERGVEATTAHEAWLRHWKGGSCGVGVIWLNGGKP